MDKTNKQSKKVPIFVILGAVGFVALILGTGFTGEKLDERIVDAQVENEELKAEIDVLKTQLNATVQILQAHEVIIQQHDVQIRSLANSTNIIAGWGSTFSQNVDERLTTLEGE